MPAAVRAGEHRGEPRREARRPATPRRRRGSRVRRSTNARRCGGRCAHSSRRAVLPEGIVVGITGTSCPTGASARRMDCAMVEPASCCDSSSSASSSCSAPATLAASSADPGGWGLLVVLVLLLLLAVHDLLQKKHSILRNYPVLGHLRFLLEGIRPELQQYFIERNFDGRPTTATPVPRSTSGQGHQGGAALRHRARPVRASATSTSSTPRAGGPDEGAAPGPDRRPGLHPALRHGAAERSAISSARCRPTRSRR